MTLFLPDAILDSMVCSNCHRLLSVGPVKVYPNNVKKCGRCTQTDDDGVVSLFDNFREHCLFKCINRFDGCRKLLRYSDVLEHEAHCTSRDYRCPMCPNNVPTYLMIRHFEGFHSDSLLTTPTFDIQLTDGLRNCRIFLYRKDNHLFFFSYNVDLIEKYALVKIFLIGGIGDMYSFTISDVSERCMWTFPIFCAPYDLEDYEGTRVDLDELNHSQIIKVEFELQVSSQNIFEIQTSKENRTETTNTNNNNNDIWTDSRDISLELLNVLKTIVVWVENHLIFCGGLLVALCAFTCLVMHASKLLPECLNELSQARKSNTECMKKLEQQKSSFVICFYAVLILLLLHFFR